MFSFSHTSTLAQLLYFVFIVSGDTSSSLYFIYFVLSLLQPMYVTRLGRIKICMVSSQNPLLFLEALGIILINNLDGFKLLLMNASLVVGHFSLDLKCLKCTNNNKKNVSYRNLLF